MESEVFKEEDRWSVEVTNMEEESSYATFAPHVRANWEAQRAMEASKEARPMSSSSTRDVANKNFIARTMCVPVVSRS